MMKPNISLCFRLLATSDLKAVSSFSSSFQSLQFVMNHKVNYGKVQTKKETIRVVTIAMICSILVSLWKFQYFQRPIYNLVEHLWWGFYCENSEPLSIFTKKLHHRCSLGFLIRLCFLKTFQRFYYFKILYIIRLLKSVRRLARWNLECNDICSFLWP